MFLPIYGVKSSATPFVSGAGEADFCCGGVIIAGLGAEAVREEKIRPTVSWIGICLNINKIESAEKFENKL